LVPLAGVSPVPSRVALRPVPRCKAAKSPWHALYFISESTGCSKRTRCDECLNCLNPKLLKRFGCLSGKDNAATPAKKREVDLLQWGLDPAAIDVDYDNIIERRAQANANCIRMHKRDGVHANNMQFRCNYGRRPMSSICLRRVRGHSLANAAKRK
jgi:hypothetical protein